MERLTNGSSLTRVLSFMPLLALCAAATGVAEDAPRPDPESPARVETFTPPKAISTPEPAFPMFNQRTGREGWVRMAFMVGPTGEPYDIAVIASSGDERFESAAIEAVEGWAFEPAVLNDTPIDAGMQFMVTFELAGGTPAARPGFVRAFRRLQQAITEGDRETADQQLEKLRDDDRNLYEEANYGLAAYQYHLEWGTAAEQYAALTSATAMDQGRGFLPDEILTPMLRTRLGLELSLNRYAQARETGHTLEERDLDPDARTSLQRVLSQIQALAESDQPIPVPGSIHESAQTFHRLLRSRFHFRDIEGDIAELRLHCDRAYVGFAYKTGMAYTVSDTLSDCTLRIIGTPGTTFTLVET